MAQGRCLAGLSSGHEPHDAVPRQSGCSPKGMMPLIHQAPLTDKTFLECFFIESYRLQKDFSLCQKIPIKNKTNQTPNPLACSLDCKTYFQEQEQVKSSKKCKTIYGALITFSHNPKAVNTDLLCHIPILSLWISQGTM